MSEGLVFCLPAAVEVLGLFLARLVPFCALLVVLGFYAHWKAYTTVWKPFRDQCWRTYAESPNWTTLLMRFLLEIIPARLLLEVQILWLFWEECKDAAIPLIALFMYTLVSVLCSSEYALLRNCYRFIEYTEHALNILQQQQGLK